MIKITDNLRIVNFKSNYDGSRRDILLSLPLDFDLNKKYSLVISPHPFGFSSLENYAYGTPDLLQNFNGWKLFLMAMEGYLIALACLGKARWKILKTYLPY